MRARSFANITNLTMNPESQENRAWNDLHTFGAAQLPFGFADRVLREARARAGAMPSLFGQFALSAATAALCFIAVAIWDASSPRAAAASSLAGWQQIAAASQDLAQAQ